MVALKEEQLRYKVLSTVLLIQKQAETHDTELLY